HTTFKATSHSKWYLDSRCFRHMTGDKALFTDLKDMADDSVIFGDGSNCKIICQGTVQLFNLPMFKNVLYVEDLKHNLLSISQICDNNHSVRFSNQCYEILNNKGFVILAGRRTSENCYIINESRSSN
ncbi:hypothetical protein PJP10_31340, partial [Mycobacterium kansasii]